MCSSDLDEAEPLHYTSPVTCADNDLGLGAAGVVITPTYISVYKRGLDLYLLHPKQILNFSVNEVCTFLLFIIELPLVSRSNFCAD